MTKFLPKLLSCSVLILMLAVFSNNSFAQISGTDAYYLYSNVTGSEPWSTTTNSEAMNTVFGEGEWILEYYETLDPDVVFGLGTCFIFMEGGDAMADELEDFLNTNAGIIQDWVAAGGHLLLNSAPNEGDGMDFLFDGVHLDYPSFTDVAEATDPDHPIFNDYYLPVGESWSGSSFGHAAVSGGDITPIIHDSFDDTRYVCAEKPWGSGTVVFGGMTPNFFHSPALEAANLRASIIAYLALCIVSDIDVGVNSILSPDDGCGLETETVTVKVRNYGFEPQTDIPVRYRLDGGGTVMQTLFGTLEPGDIVEFSFTVLADVSIPGPHSIEAWTALLGDTIISNDSTTKIINNIPITSTFPYYEDFEDGASSWEASGISSSWELGSPASFVINTPPPATPASVNSWKTDLDGDFNYGEKSYVTGPCFDFTTLEQPYVELDYWVATYEFYGYDGARLEYSLDGGGSWQSVNYLVGNDAEKENWYNDGCYSFNPFIFPYDSAWTRSSGGWKTAHYNMSGLAGETQVQFRIHFASTFFTGYDGFAFDNFRIQDPYEHDLEMTALAAPESMPSLTDAEIVTVTVTNVGLTTETDFDVSYQVDGGTIVTEAYTGPGLAYGESVDIDFVTTADLSVDGDYDFKIWTGLATDEYNPNDTLYASVSNLMPISGDAAYYLYSNVYGGSEPWFTTTNTEAMNTVFGEGEWTTEYYETLDPEIVFGLGTCFIFMEGGDAMADELKTFLENNETTIQNWVASGGHLFLNSAPNEGSGMDFLFGGVHLDYAWYTGTVEATDPAHPIFNYFFTPTGTSWTGGSFGHATVSGGDITPLIHDVFTPDRYVLAEKSWGVGNVLFGGMTPNAFHSPALEAANLRASIIGYLAVCTLSDTDVGVNAIIAPTDGCGLGSEETVTVKVRNYGFEPQSAIPVKYNVDGGGIATEIIAGPLAPGDIIEVTFTVPADLSTPGPHSVIAWTELPGDTILSNDTTIKVINNIPIISTYPYNEDFEDGESGWTSGGSNSTWEFGSPEGPVISGAPPATPGSVNSWTTSLTDYYNLNENSYVLGPCFDFTTLILPYIKLDIWWDIEYFWDGARLEYSLDAGSSWILVGDIGTGDNWYTAGVYSFGYDPFTGVYGPGWEGVSGSWVTAKHDLSFLAGEPQVQLRVRFASDGSVLGDGFAFDNINIQDPYPDDIGVVDVTTPSTAIYLSATEEVTVTIENFGTNPQSVFNVGYTLDGGTPVIEAYDGAEILPGETADYTFAATVDVSEDGTYDICSWTSLTGDDDITNDTICEEVKNLPPISAYYVCSNVYGGSDPWGTFENQEAMDDVYGVGGWGFDFFETAIPDSVFSGGICFVFLEGSDAMADELEDFLTTNAAMIEDWVAGGGHLFLNAAPNEGSGMDFGFDGVSLIYSYFSDNVTAADAAHPIFVGPFTPVVTDYTGGSFGHARVEGGDISPIILNSFDADGYVLAEKEWGGGRAVFGGMTTPNFHSPVDEARNLRRNIIEYLKSCLPVDVGVSDLISPESGCGLGSAEVTIEITNYGPGTVTSIPVRYSVDGLTPVEETAGLTILSGESGEFTFTTLADLSEPGDHTIEVWTEITGDGDASNDLFVATVNSLATPIIDLGLNQTVCDEFTIDAGNPGSTYSWSTGATTQTIVVTETGTYSVTVTDPVSGCAATDAVTITVNYSPTASFTYEALGLFVEFSNTSTGGASYSWDFGDGGSATDVNPNYTYDAAGSYTVTLTVTNDCGSDVYSAVVSVTVGIENIGLANAAQIYPNPTSGITVLDVNFSQVYDVKFELVNALGETLWISTPGEIQSGSYEIDMRNYADGIYQLKVSADGKEFSKPIVLTK